ncbi:nucleoside monophosphate kinase [Candidatus Gracilibacteria bacterium]|nr:nucleoside monophosphate kinase [Candidatus Gracilibacteria bacterium]
MDLIFFGMQGAGKGTIGKEVAKKYGMQIFETGGELRKLSQEDSELGKKIKSIIEAGHLVSNEVVMEIVENFVNNLTEGSQVLFDGIPRKVEQAESLNALLSKHNRTYTAVLINIAKETALTRLTTRRICSVCKTVYPANYQGDKCECGHELVTRKDDNPEAIQTRLNAFENETKPAIELYKENMMQINGEGDIETVKTLSFAALDPIMGAL